MAGFLLEFVMKPLALLALFFLGGCQAAIDLNQYAARSQSVVRVEKGHALWLQTLQPKPASYARLRVYIEGDGRAWITANRASLDPTPTSALVLELFTAEDKPSVYMARPCQFVQSPACRQALWTDARYSQEVLEAMDQALTALKERFGVREFELVGYSGGAALALLLAATRADVVQVQTLAGNVAPHAWTHIKGLSPLTQSLDPSDTPERLRTLAQRHWLGREDRVVPEAVFNAYSAKVKPVCTERIVVNADHWQGYLQPWLAGKDRAIQCP